MDNLHLFMQRLEEYLNAQPSLNRRNNHIKSTIENGKEVVELNIKGRDVFTIELKDKRFHVRSGTATSPLLSWSVPLALFKEVVLGKVKILYAMLDKVGALSFDTPHFTHWNGITALAVILMAQEMVKKNPELQQVAENL